MFSPVFLFAVSVAAVLRHFFITACDAMVVYAQQGLTKLTNHTLILQLVFSSVA